MHNIRSATGVLVLSTALLVGSAGGAISAADTGTSDSTSGSSTASDSTAAKSAADSSSEDAVGASSSSAALSDTSAADTTASLSADEDEAAEALSAGVGVEVDGVDGVEIVDAALAGGDAEAVAGVESAPVDVVAVETTGDQSVSIVPSTAGEPEVAESDAVQTVASGSGSGSSETGTVAASSIAATSTATDSGTSVVTAAASEPTSQDAQPGDSESSLVTQPQTLEEVLATMSTGMADTITTVVVTLGNTATTVAVSLGTAAAAITPTIFSLFSSTTPISDLVALVEMIWDSVAQSATAVMRFPSDLFVGLGMSQIGTIGDGIGPALIGVTNDHRRDFVVGEGSPMGPLSEQSPLSLPMAPAYQVDDVVGRSVFAVGTPIAFAALAAPTQIVPASIPALAGDYESLFDRAFGALLVPLSLWALATGALPGLVGLLVVFGAGARVGYRQAKAGLSLKVAGIARFAGSGPLGVVRSGSFVALHQRGVRGGRAPIARWSRLGDQVA